MLYKFPCWRMPSGFWTRYCHAGERLAASRKPFRYGLQTTLRMRHAKRRMHRGPQEPFRRPW